MEQSCNDRIKEEFELFKALVDNVEAEVGKEAAGKEYLNAGYFDLATTRFAFLGYFLKENEEFDRYMKKIGKIMEQMHNKAAAVERVRKNMGLVKG